MGKQVVSREEFLTRIRAAVIARDSIPGGSDLVRKDFSCLPASFLCHLQVIIGRTDSAQVLGMDEAVTRLQLAADAGADVCFIEGVKTEEFLRSTVEALAPKPVSKLRVDVISHSTDLQSQVLVNVISGGLTPSFTYKEAETFGAKIISTIFFLLFWQCSTSMNSFFFGLLRCYDARRPSCDAFAQEYRNRFLICQGNGSQSLLRSNGSVVLLRQFYVTRADFVS